MFSSRSDNAYRSNIAFGRATIEKANDKTLVQEHDISLMKDETKNQVERFGNYGFSSVPLPPSDDTASAGGSGTSAATSGAATGGATKKKKAEAIVAFLGGNRSHGVVIAVDDRRHRPQSLEPGESTLYDDQAQKIHVTRKGIVISGGDDKLKQGQSSSGSGSKTSASGGASSSGGQQKSRSKKLPITLTTGDATTVIAKDKITDTIKKTTRELKDGNHTFKVGKDTEVDVTKDKITLTKGKTKVVVSASSVVVTAEKVYLGGEGGSAVVTVAGPSSRVFAVL